MNTDDEREGQVAHAMPQGNGKGMSIMPQKGGLNARSPQLATSSIGKSTQPVNPTLEKVASQNKAQVLSQLPSRDRQAQDETQLSR